jgi:hypothetical protein
MAGRIDDISWLSDGFKSESTALVISDSKHVSEYIQ